LFYRFKKQRKMKKLVFMFVAIAAISFASCGNKTQQAAPVDSDSVAAPVDSAATDSAAAPTDSAAAPATAAPATAAPAK
jgi:predicted small secreted protein